MPLAFMWLSLALALYNGGAAKEVSCPASEGLPEIRNNGESLLHTASRRSVDTDADVSRLWQPSASGPQVSLLQSRTTLRRADAGVFSVSQPSATGARSNSSTQELKRLYPWYHTSDELIAEARSLAAGCGGALSLTTAKEDGVEIDVATVRKPGSHPVNRVFILFGEHSRELIGPESGLHFLRVLCGAAEGDSAKSAAETLEDSEFQLVLNGNPLSRKLVEGGSWCTRANPNGVDLNRNWSEKWRSSSAGGAEPFSEPETRIFKRLVVAYEPTTFLSVHSGTRGLYMPWAFDMTHLATRNRQSMLRILRNLDKDHCQCPYGAAGKEVGYSCPGTSLDWVYDELKTPYAFAWEIHAAPDRDKSLSDWWQDKLKSGGDSLLEQGEHLGHPFFLDLFQQHASDFVNTRSSDMATKASSQEACFSIFNPDTLEKYIAEITNWAGAYLDMANLIVADMRKQGARVPAGNATDGPVAF